MQNRVIKFKLLLLYNIISMLNNSCKIFQRWRSSSPLFSFLPPNPNLQTVSVIEFIHNGTVFLINIRIAHNAILKNWVFCLKFAIYAGGRRSRFRKFYTNSRFVFPNRISETWSTMESAVLQEIHIWEFVSYFSTRRQISKDQGAKTKLGFSLRRVPLRDGEMCKHFSKTKENCNFAKKL